MSGRGPRRPCCQSCHHLLDQVSPLRRPGQRMTDWTPRRPCASCSCWGMPGTANRCPAHSRKSLWHTAHSSEAPLNTGSLMHTHSHPPRQHPTPVWSHRQSTELAMLNQRFHLRQVERQLHRFFAKSPPVPGISHACAEVAQLLQVGREPCKVTKLPGGQAPPKQSAACGHQHSWYGSTGTGKGP